MSTSGKYFYTRRHPVPTLEDVCDLSEFDKPKKDINNYFKESNKYRSSNFPTASVQMTSYFSNFGSNSQKQTENVTSTNTFSYNSRLNPANTKPKGKYDTKPITAFVSSAQNTNTATKLPGSLSSHQQTSTKPSIASNYQSKHVKGGGFKQPVSNNTTRKEFETSQQSTKSKYQPTSHTTKIAQEHTIPKTSTNFNTPKPNYTQKTSANHPLDSNAGLISSKSSSHGQPKAHNIGPTHLPSYHYQEIPMRPKSDYDVKKIQQKKEKEIYQSKEQDEIDNENDIENSQDSKHVTIEMPMQEANEEVIEFEEEEEEEEEINEIINEELENEEIPKNEDNLEEEEIELDVRSEDSLNSSDADEISQINPVNPEEEDFQDIDDNNEQEKEQLVIIQSTDSDEENTEIIEDDQLPMTPEKIIPVQPENDDDEHLPEGTQDQIDKFNSISEIMAQYGINDDAVTIPQRKVSNIPIIRADELTKGLSSDFEEEEEEEDVIDFNGKADDLNEKVNSPRSDLSIDFNLSDPDDDSTLVATQSNKETESPTKAETKKKSPIKTNEKSNHSIDKPVDNDSSYSDNSNDNIMFNIDKLLEDCKELGDVSQSDEEDDLSGDIKLKKSLLDLAEEEEEEEEDADEEIQDISEQLNMIFDKMNLTKLKGENSYQIIFNIADKILESQLDMVLQPH